MSQLHQMKIFLKNKRWEQKRAFSSVFLLFYLVILVRSKGGDRAMRTTTFCLHKGGEFLMTPTLPVKCWNIWLNYRFPYDSFPGSAALCKPARYIYLDIPCSDPCAGTIPPPRTYTYVYYSRFQISRPRRFISSPAGFRESPLASLPRLTVNFC